MTGKWRIRMKKEEIKSIFNEFLSAYNEEEKNEIWKEHSKTFRDFWKNKVLNPSVKEINDSEVDPIIRILDRHGKGNTRRDEAVAMVMITQGVWRRMFQEINKQRTLQELLNKIFFEKNDQEKISLIDQLYKANEGRKNSLTGKSGNAINTMLFTFDPDSHTSMISLNDRRKFIEYFNLPNTLDFDKDSP